MKIKSTITDSNYTHSVKLLINAVYPPDLSTPSLFSEAISYFRDTPVLNEKLKIDNERLAFIKFEKKKKGSFNLLQNEIKKTEKQIETQRLERNNSVIAVAKNLIALCEADNFEDTQTLSAKFLSTIVLITRGNVSNFAFFHQRLKPLYKAVLSLRLIDKAISNKALDTKFLQEYSGILTRFNGDNAWRIRWENEIAIPIIISCIAQDVGMHHPEAHKILHGADGSLDPFRVLAPEQRKELLRINYQQTLDYIKNGLGMRSYIGNSKEERDAFVLSQQKALNFTLEISKQAFTGKGELGEILKIPQIYTSIVLSTKPDYSRLNLPKGYLLIDQLAKKGQLNPKLAKAFIAIVGYFPLGFGITYIPRNEKGIEREQYEFAIVTQLNPKNPAEPRCRQTSRNLTFISSGSDEVIKKEINLYFSTNKKRLMRIGKERLIQIMTMLYKNFTRSDIDELIPSYWEASDYFSLKKNQNLWNKQN